MFRYRTEVMIAADRYVCLQLPPDLPTGRATVIVLIDEPAERPQDPTAAADDVDHDDVEWWEEFDESDVVE